ncbi:hypothetical protein D9M70_453850 [compost metagenome]
MPGAGLLRHGERSLVLFLGLAQFRFKLYQLGLELGTLDLIGSLNLLLHLLHGFAQRIFFLGGILDGTLVFPASFLFLSNLLT